MTTNRLKTLSEMTGRQKGIAIVLVAIVIFVLYEIMGMFGGGKASTPPPKVATVQAPAPQPMPTPQPVALVKQTPAAPSQEQEALRQQQEVQKQYVDAMNELQSLKLAREIAEANQAIIASKLATITAQKSILNLLTQQAPITPTSGPGSYAQGLVNPTKTNTENMNPPSSAPSQPQANYSVVSVSQLQGKWNAVLGYQGNLYSVGIGDVLPTDQSKVISIDKSGVTLEKDGEETKVSLVPII